MFLIYANCWVNENFIPENQFNIIPSDVPAILVHGKMSQ